MNSLCLAIDTSTDYASLALLDGDALVFELTWLARQNHTVELLPYLNYLLTQHHLSLKEVGTIIVAKGPGSFNGTRVGVSVAKGLAMSLGIPLVGVNSLAVTAYPHGITGLPVSPVFNAGRGEIATALYQMKNDAWLELKEPYITTLGNLVKSVTRKTVFCGEFIPQIEKELKDRLGAKAVIPPPAANLRRASCLAELGRRLLQSGLGDDPATLEPVYLRRPAITQPKKR
ncbi:MAG: tRNA (adenosine(37)-N6)-threonylcarbamoyltransferase complex dimerization subunit type 1 TsaB [Chloroflexota bacterium]